MNDSLPSEPLPGHPSETVHRSAEQVVPASATRGYLVVFGLLAVLTVLEVAVVSPEVGASRAPAIATLIILAISKAALVALFFMHLRSERRALRNMVLLPFLFPIVVGLAVIAESAWRRG